MTSEPRRQTAFLLTEEEISWLDHAAKERHMSRNAFVSYMANAFDKGLVFIMDPSSWGKVKLELENQMARTARVVARKEARLVLQEEGFVTSRFEG